MDVKRLNHFTIEICVFYCGSCHCFYRSTVFFLYIVFLIIYWSMIVYECICFHLTVSESDIIKLFNQSVSAVHISGYLIDNIINDLCINLLWSSDTV